MAPIKLGYWEIRGLAHPARLLLGYTDTEFEDVLYPCGDAPDYDVSSWFSVKESIGLDFPNLPYLIDGDIKITQSNAIMRYIGRKNKMDGETEEEKVRVDMMENQAMDFRNKFVDLCYRNAKQNYEEACSKYDKSVASTLNRFEKFLGDNKYFAGNKLTYVDFIMYELLTHHLIYKSNILEPYPKLTDFRKRFEEIPKIAAFMKSDKCFKGPINNKMAVIGNTAKV